MHIDFFINEHNSLILNIITPDLYQISDCKTEAWFHDELCSDMFWIRLNVYFNEKFKHPVGSSQITIFDLLIELAEKYKAYPEFSYLLDKTKEVKDYFFKTRYYRYYISPHVINLNTSFSELINIQANYSKHHLYRLNIIKDKIKKYFEENNIQNFENEDYNEHIKYFKEAVLDDRLNFNTTHIIETIGSLFLEYHKVIHSKYISVMCRFYLEKLTFFRFPESRLTDYLPKTPQYLIEKDTSIQSPINKSGG